MALSRAERAARVIRAVQGEVSRTSLRAVARAANVSTGAIVNANRGSVPQGDTLDRLEVWAKSVGFNLDAEPVGDPLSEDQLFEDFLLSFERALRSVGRGIPEISDLERQERLRIAINGLIQTLGALGRTVPGRLYELHALAERGEL